MGPERASIALVGIGNPLAGDDGVGPAALTRLQERHGDDARLRFLHLESDLFALADLLASARHFIFLDAVAGAEPGLLRVSTAYQRGFAASLHQTDLAAVMGSLEALRTVEPFPTWEVWGITIQPPREYREGLSPVVSKAVLGLVDALGKHLSLLLEGRPAAAPCSRFP